MDAALDSLPVQDDSTTEDSAKTGHPKVSRAASEACELQRLMMEDVRKPDVKPSVRALIARSWVQVQEMRLRIAMKPAPKPIDVQQPAKARRVRSLNHVAPLPDPPAAPQ